MDAGYEFVRSVLRLDEEITDGFRIGIDEVIVGGETFYAIGVCDKSSDMAYPNSILFTAREFDCLVRQLVELKHKETELDKFKRDYIQQSHNGAQMKEKRS